MRRTIILSGAGGLALVAIATIVATSRVASGPSPDAQVAAALAGFHPVAASPSQASGRPMRSGGRLRTSSYRRAAPDLAAQLRWIRATLRAPEWYESRLAGGDRIFAHRRGSALVDLIARVPAFRSVRRLAPSEAWMVRVSPRRGGLEAVCLSIRNR